MGFMRECAIIFGITLVGEFLNAVLPFPVPAGVYGLFLLLFLLCKGIVKLKDVEATGNFFLDIMPVMFIPATVGLVEQFGLIKEILVPIVVISLVSTLVVMGITGKTAEFMMRNGKRKEDDRK